MNRILLLGCFTIGLAGAPASQAAVLARDLFTYGTNTDLTGPGFGGSNGYSSDIGFSTSWLNVDPGFGTIPNLSGDNTSLPFPSGVPGFELGSRIQDSNGGFAARYLTTAVNFASDGVFYFSALFNNNRPFNSGNEYLYLGLSQQTGPTTADPVFSMGIRSDGSALVGQASTSGLNDISGSPLVNAATYMMVARLTTSAASPDIFEMNYYQAGVDTIPADEPTTWSLSYSANLSAPAANLLTLSLGPTTTAQFDEFYFGDSYQSVTFGYVPEPDTFALLVFAAGVLRVLRARHPRA